MGPCNPNLDFIDTLTPPAAVEDPRGFAEMVHARLNAGWDFSSPNFRFVALDNTRAERKRAYKRTNFALAIQRELVKTKPLTWAWRR